MEKKQFELAPSNPFTGVPSTFVPAEIPTQRDAPAPQSLESYTEADAEADEVAARAVSREYLTYVGKGS